MGHTQKTLLLLGASLAIIAGVVYYLHYRSDGDDFKIVPPPPSTDNQVVDLSKGMIHVTYPQPGDTITSPLVVTGTARGNWFFEASFPFVVTDADGKVLAEHYATAEGEWMTTEFVPFTGTINFTKPANVKSGFVILKRDNPSDLPQNDASIKIPIYFN